MNENKNTLEEILQLGYPESFTWLSNKPGIDVEINWISRSVDDLRLGDVLVLENTRLTNEILNQSKESGCSAIVIVGEADVKSLSIPNGLGVISLPGENSSRKVQKMLMDLILNKRAYLLSRSIQIHERLTKITAEGGGLIGLTRAMTDLSGCGIVVQDKRLNVLCDSATINLTPIWEDILGQMSENSSLPDEFGDRKAIGKEKILLRQDISEGLVRIVTPINVGGVARGYLSLVDFSDKVDVLDELVTEQGAIVCAIEMSRIKAVREVEKRLKGNLLTALLQENIAPRDAVLWIQSMGLDLDQHHVAIRFSWDGSETPSMRRLETILNGEVSKGAYKALIDTLGLEVICICQVAAKPSRPDSAIKLANAVSEIALDEFPEIPMRCGIGSPAEDLAHWGDSFRQAGQALEMTRRLADRNPRYFPDLSVYRLLLQLEYHPDLQKFKNEILAPLISYEGGTELIKTLEAYFENNGVLSQAAESLFIHRNTLIYRMERIAEITGLDLNHNETRLAVQLALRIHRMTSKVNNDPWN